MGVTSQPNDFIGFSAEYSESTRTPEALIYRLTEGSYPPVRQLYPLRTAFW
ncbi:MAG TPA: hypothetical protein VK184_00640 [Nostocaceae cyanobacterium]|nr:hypothetical protein [Nostocaceae cyanobacterium]